MHSVTDPLYDLTRYTLLILALFGFIGVLPARTVRSGAPQSLRFNSYNSQTSIRVSDKETDDPLIGATVSIFSQGDTLRGTTVKENFYRLMATYTCDRIFRDSVDLEVTYIGYKPYHRRFAAGDFRGLIPVRMEVDEQSIAQVVVVGKQVAMVFKGDTTVYYAGAFKTLADDRFSELLKQLPGVEIKDNGIYADGQQVKRVLVDGKNFFGTKPDHILTDLEASDVKNVRIYEELSPEAKRLGDNTAEKEKVMNVETKSKRSVIQGGKLEATIGASLEEDYSGRREIRHSEAGEYYLNSEKGNLRLEASNSKDDGQKENASFNSKITPSKQTNARAEYTYRRGDSTNVFTVVHFDRSRQSSVGRSRIEYFPTEAYSLRTEESRNESLSKSLRAGLTNMTTLQRGKSSFSAFGDFSYDNGSSRGHNRTRQQIDQEQTSTDLNTNSDDRNISLMLNTSYRLVLSERSTLSLQVSGNYDSSNREGWQIDTAASNPGLEVRLRNDGSGGRYGIAASVDYGYKLGKNGRLSAAYNFNRDYNRSKQLSVDFLDDPQGKIDTVNSYNYTTDTYNHGVQLGAMYNDDDIRFSAFMTGALYQLARSERFPEEGHFPRQFYQLGGMVYFSVGKPRRRFSFNLNSFPQVISSEALRSTVDATNPLALRAGNPHLKMQNLITGSTGFSFYNAKKALTFSVRINGGYTLNYVASRRTLFLEETYLPQWDYTAQKGAQLTTQTNVGGCYNIGVSTGYSQQIAALRSTLEANVSYDFRQTPYFLGEDLFHSASHSMRIGLGFNSGFSTKVRIGINSSTSMSSYSTQQSRSEELREQVSGRVDLRFGKYFGTVGTLYEFYCNSQSHTLTRHNVILNASAGRKFGKANRLGVSLGVIDILNRPDYASTRFETDYIITSSTSYLGRYCYLKADYTF